MSVSFRATLRNLGAVLHETPARNKVCVFLVALSLSLRTRRPLAPCNGGVARVRLETRGEGPSEVRRGLGPQVVPRFRRRRSSQNGRCWATRAGACGTSARPHQSPDRPAQSDVLGGWAKSGGPRLGGRTGGVGKMAPRSPKGGGRPAIRSWMRPNRSSSSWPRIRPIGAG